jgi:hypothetical protein
MGSHAQWLAHCDPKRLHQTAPRGCAASAGIPCRRECSAASGSRSVGVRLTTRCSSNNVPIEKIGLEFLFAQRSPAKALNHHEHHQTVVRTSANLCPFEMLFALALAQAQDNAVAGAAHEWRQSHELQILRG